MADPQVSLVDSLALDHLANRRDSQPDSLLEDPPCNPLDSRLAGLHLNLLDSLRPNRLDSLVGNHLANQADDLLLSPRVNPRSLLPVSQQDSRLDVPRLNPLAILLANRLLSRQDVLPVNLRLIPHVNQLYSLRLNLLSDRPCNRADSQRSNPQPNPLEGLLRSPPDSPLIDPLVNRLEFLACSLRVSHRERLHANPLVCHHVSQLASRCVVQPLNQVVNPTLDRPVNLLDIRLVSHPGNLVVDPQCSRPAVLLVCLPCSQRAFRH